MFYVLTLVYFNDMKYFQEEKKLPPKKNFELKYAMN